MRVLAIGLGGAGSRVVDILYDHDQRSKVCCMNAVAIDIDPNSLMQLHHLPDQARIFFPPVGVTAPDDVTKIIDVEEVMTRIQSMDTVGIDAILFCCGLGGNVIDVAPSIVEELRMSYVEPIFALAILPCLNEGRAVSAKAADDLDMLQAIMDAVILFDNETWSRKILAASAASGEEEGSGIMAQIRRNPLNPTRNPREHYSILNERIARQIGLLLRAGEFNEHGIEVAEVVLDAGEVLNTLVGMGLVAVGYASERLPTGWLDILFRRRSQKYFIQGSHEKAARIVSLAKKAVYEEVSIPCDLTSAEKALVLIAGPSAELSMKGFQTVRKWIDRSIAGLEMRSGDYPVKNTSFVGIIVMLSGLSNIPRVEEIRDIRTDYLLELEEERLRAEEERLREEETVNSGDAEGDGMIQYFASPFEEAFLEESDHMREPSTLKKDEMIEMPGGARSNQKESDEMIEMLPRAEKKQDGGSIILPPKPGSQELDITRSTAVTSSVPAPKESTFNPKGLSIEKSAPKEDLTRSAASLPPVQRPDDGVLTGEKISLDPVMRPPGDSIFDEPALPMREEAPRPKENLLGQARKRSGKGSPRPKEVDPSGGKLKVIDPVSDGQEGAGAESPEKREDDEPDEGGITWIL